MNGLMLHCGGGIATRDQVRDVRTPAPTDTWMPIPHFEVVERVCDAVRDIGLKIHDEALALQDGRDYGLDGTKRIDIAQARMFGLLRVENGKAADDYATVVGFRNSHDKTFPVTIGIGSLVFICDNLAFGAEVVIRRKHTSHLRDDIPKLIARAVDMLTEHRGLQDRRIECYKNVEVNDQQVHDLMIRAMDGGVVAPSKMPKVLHEWREPRFEDFRPRTVWSLFNGFTHVLKDYNLFDNPRRTQVLHGLCDGLAGVAIPTLSEQVIGDAEDTEVDARLN